ncbi:MAG: hypothetical protein ACE14P_03345 [Methanotrichaceae archaeon]
MDTTDFNILKAISDLKVANPKADRINAIVHLDPEELGARLGVLEMEGYIKTQSGTSSSDSLPNGIYAAGLTNLGRRALTGNRWQ